MSSESPNYILEISESQQIFTGIWVVLMTYKINAKVCVKGIVNKKSQQILWFTLLSLLFFFKKLPREIK